jgi:ubiquinone/menaquinone biosynthesis C-methylase UbiE
MDCVQNAAAINVHSQQAGDFAARYEALARDPYSSCFTYSRMRLEQALAECLPPSGAGRRALDVGCGTGHHLEMLAARGFEVAGIDGSAEMLAEAHRVYPFAELQQANVDRLPFPDRSFDLVICIEVLRYLPSVEPCLAEMARVLRPGGLCVATAAPAFSSNGYALVNRLALLAPVGDLLRLKQYFTRPSRLRRQLGRAGFGVIEIRGVYTGPINWVERLAPGRLPSFLRRWEKWDRRLADGPALRGLSNMLLATAVLRP